MGTSVCETLIPPLDFRLDSSLVCDGAEFAPWGKGSVCAMDPSTDTTSNSKRTQRKLRVLPALPRIDLSLGSWG